MSLITRWSLSSFVPSPIFNLAQLSYRPIVLFPSRPVAQLSHRPVVSSSSFPVAQFSRRQVLSSLSFSVAQFSRRPDFSSTSFPVASFPVTQFSLRAVVLSPSCRHPLSVAQLSDPALQPHLKLLLLFIYF